jgi:hypothetical protein
MTTLTRPQLEIRLPSLYRDLIPMSSSTAIEHPPLRCRANETVLADAFRWINDPLNFGKTALFLCLRSTKLKVLLDSWMDASMLKTRRNTVTAEASLWFMRDPDLDVADLPFDKVHRLYIVDAQAIRPDLVTALRRRAEEVIACGEMCDREHWFYSFAREPACTLYKVPANDVLRAFPDTREEYHALIRDIPGDAVRRRFHLEDVIETPSPLSVFCRRRLLVRSDKTAEFLNDEQRAIAAKQEGTPILPLHVSKLQMRYLAQKRLAALQGKPLRFLLLKYRRGGFTTIEQASSYRLAVTKPRQQVATLAHTAKSTQRIFSMVKTFHANDPRAPELIGDSKSQLEFAGNASSFFIGTAGGKGFGRGFTLNKVHGSEVSKWCDQKPDRVDDLVAGLTEATAHGEVILETTPDGIEWFATAYKEAKLGANNWTPIFLRWFDDPANRATPGTFSSEEIRDTLDDKEKFLVEHEGLTASQIAFRRSKKRELKRLFLQEYPEDDESCFIVSGTCFFDVDLIMSLQDVIRGLDKSEQGTRRSIPGGYEHVWEPPQKGVEYVAGSDTSEGLPGCDPSGVGVMRKDNAKQVACVHGFFDPRRLAEHCARLSKLYNEALLGVERENHGHAVLSNLINIGYSTPHYRGGPLYYHSRAKAKGDLDRTAKAGWSTNDVTRPIMLDDLCEYMEAPDIEDRVRHMEFLGECLTFRKQQNGRWDHDAGCHDDTLFFWGIANQMRKHRKTKVEIFTVER